VYMDTLISQCRLLQKKDLLVGSLIKTYIVSVSIQLANFYLLTAKFLPQPVDNAAKSHWLSITSLFRYEDPQDCQQGYQRQWSLEEARNTNSQQRKNNMAKESART
jgi:hypothetical protein